MEIFAVIREHFAGFLFGEACDFVEPCVCGVVGADVESACQVVERYGRNSSYEKSFDGCLRAVLDGVEKRAQVSRSVRLVHIATELRVVGEDVVGEVVILVDEEVNLLVGLFNLLNDVFEFVNGVFVHFFKFFLRIAGKELRIDIAEVFEPQVAIRVEICLVVVDVSIDHRKVEMHDKI